MLSEDTKIMLEYGEWCKKKREREVALHEEIAVAFEEYKKQVMESK